MQEANWLEKAQAKSLNEVIEPHGKLLNHPFATFHRVIGNAMHMSGWSDSLELHLSPIILKVVVGVSTSVIVLEERDLEI